MGNRELFLKLVEDFRRDYADKVPQIRAELEKGDLEQAKRQVHTLKGTSATLSAVRLSKAAAELEIAILGNEDWAPAMESVEEAMSEVLGGSGDSEAPMMGPVPHRAGDA